VTASVARAVPAATAAMVVTPSAAMPRRAPAAMRIPGRRERPLPAAVAARPPAAPRAVAAEAAATAALEAEALAAPRRLPPVRVALPAAMAPVADLSRAGGLPPRLRVAPVALPARLVPAAVVAARVPLRGADGSAPCALRSLASEWVSSRISRAIRREYESQRGAVAKQPPLLLFAWDSHNVPSL